MAPERAPLELELAPGRRTTLLCLSALSVIALALLVRFLNGGIDEWGGDNVHFLLLAKALACGQGYVEIHIQGQPPHTHYPPRFPLLLVPLVAAGAPMLLLKGWVALLSLAGIAVVYLLLARMWGPLVALIVSAATLVSSVFLDPGFSTMSDGPYLLISSLALLALTSLLAARQARWSTCFAVGLLVAGAILTRLVGMALLPALAAAAVLGPSPATLRARLGRAALVSTVACLLVGAWFLRGLILDPAGERAGAPSAVAGAAAAAEAETAILDPQPPPDWTPTYLKEFQKQAQPGGVGGISGGGDSLLDRPALNIRDLWLRLRWMPAPEWLAKQGGAAVLAFQVAVLASAVTLAALALVGFAGRTLARRSICEFYVAVYICGILLWIGGGPRLLLPVLPFLMAYVGDGTRTLTLGVASLLGRARPAWDGRRLRAAQLIALLAVLAFSFGVTFGSPRLRNRLEGRYKGWWGDYLEMIAVLGKRSGPDDLVITMPEQVPYYLAGVRAARLRRTVRGPAKVLADVLASGATYVITTPFRSYRDSGSLDAAIARFPGRFAPIAHSGQVWLFAVRRTDDS